MKPFLSKGSANILNICLLEDGNVVNDPVSVCSIVNDHFSNIANDIGRGLSGEEVQNHTSVIKIREHVGLPTRLVLKCGPAHLSANARDESNASANANAQQLNQLQVQMQMRSS